MLEDEPFPDPHVHAQIIVMDWGRIRAVMTRALGRAPILPATVETACRQRRPVAMTSVLPERVTCLPCREAARAAHLRAAEALEDLATLPTASSEHIQETQRRALEHRDLAHRLG
jgi:hypothetical protein